MFLKTKQLRGIIPPANNAGGQKVFSAEEENQFVAHAIAMSSFGFPITTMDLRCVVKAYLERSGRKVPCFKNGNLPGREWARSFMARHKDVLSQRLSKNISYARAANDEEVLDIFFKNLEEELKDMPPENIWNFDETNVQDDPGSKKVITRRGSKYPEQIQNSSKSSTSIMVCGNAAGETLPLYVCYKAEKLWSNWTENGPEGTRYNRSKSGWFDHNTFEDWFFSLALPRLKKQQGKKALIGDNLSSHVSLAVVKACEENDIKFIALPPNATHLLQPLDVAYFRPMKIQWRKVLGEWKQSPSGSRCATVPKDELPRLLKQLMTALAPDAPQNLKSGFRKTGIYPLNKMEVLQRLPEAVLDSSLGSMRECVSDVFIEELRKRREDATRSRAPKRRKNLNVPAGKSISSEEVEAAIAASEASKSKKGKKKTKNPTKKSSQKKARKEVEETDDSDDAFSVHESEDSSGEESFTSLMESPPTSPPPNINSDEEENGSDIQDEPRFRVGDYVVVNFEGQMYPGRVTVARPEEYMVNAMARSGKLWKWPAKKDEILYSSNEVLYKINAPQEVKKSGLFEVKEID